MIQFDEHILQMGGSTTKEITIFGGTYSWEPKGPDPPNATFTPKKALLRETNG